jgi:hypothetical protein
VTFQQLCALDTEALNGLIEVLCYPDHDWQPLDMGEGRTWYVLEHADAPGRRCSSTPHLHYTASWDTAMPLFWKYGMAMTEPCDLPRTIECGFLCIPVHTEEEARLQIGRLAVWCALQEEAHAVS